MSRVSASQLEGQLSVTRLYDATEAFAGSALEIALDAAMASLNADHPDAVFEYSVSGREITFLQRDGGEIVISDFTTATGYETVAATIEAVGFTTGATKIAQQYDTSVWWVNRECGGDACDKDRGHLDAKPRRHLLDGH